MINLHTAITVLGSYFVKNRYFGKGYGLNYRLIGLKEVYLQLGHTRLLPKLPLIKQNLSSLDEIVDKNNPARPVAFTVNTFERCLGILDSFANNSAIAKSLLLVPKAEMSFYLKRFHDQNLLRPERQTEYCTLSAYARHNILAVRALLVISPDYHLPLEDTRRPAATGSAAVTDVLYTDTSGLPKLATDKDYRGTCLGAYLPAPVSTYLAMHLLTHLGIPT